MDARIAVFDANGTNLKVLKANGRAISSKSRGRHQLTKKKGNQMLISNAGRLRVDSGPQANGMDCGQLVIMG